MFQLRLSWLRTSLLTLAGLLLASGVTWAHGGGGGGHGGGGGGHGGFGGGHGGGMHVGGYGGMHHGGIGYGGIGYGGLGYGLGLYGGGYGLGYSFGLYGGGLGYGGLGYGGLGYGLGYGRGYATSGFGYGQGYPYYGFGFSGYSYPYYGYGGGYPYRGSNYGFSRGALPYASGGTALYGNSVGNGYTSPLRSNYTNYYPPSAQTQAQTPPPKDDMAHLWVVVPENAELWFNGAKTKQTGKEREFVSPALKSDKHYSYEIKARWMKDGKPVEQVRTVHVQANDWKPIDFTKPEASVKKTD